jgi:four helix bundle protein
MPFAHRKFPVYLTALDFVSMAHTVMGTFPPGFSSVANQLLRASTSIVFNISEGAGKFAPADKARFYEIAAGSTTECSGILDVLLRLKLIDLAKNEEGIAMLESIDRGLSALAIARRNVDTPAPKNQVRSWSGGRGQGRGEGEGR